MKLYTIGLLLALLFCLSGCTPREPNLPTDSQSLPPTGTEQQSPAPSPSAPEETEEQTGLAAGEELRTCTIERAAGGIDGPDGYSQNVNLWVALEYVYDTEAGKAVRFTDAISLELTLPGVEDAAFDTGGFNVEVSDNEVRISATGRVSYTVPDAALSQGGDLSAVTVENGDSAVTTAVKTYVLELELSDLEE